MRISRKEMEEIIRRGESVIIDGQIYTDVASLPSEAELAKGNKEQEEEVRKSLKAQMEALKVQVALLDDAKSESNKQKEDKDGASDNFGFPAAEDNKDQQESEKAVMAAEDNKDQQESEKAVIEEKIKAQSAGKDKK